MQCSVAQQTNMLLHRRLLVVPEMLLTEKHACRHRPCAENMPGNWPVHARV